MVKLRRASAGGVCRSASVPHAVSFKLLCVSTLLPHLRITVSVKARKHDDILLGFDVENTVGKSPQESTSDIPMDHSESEGILLKGIEALVECKQKLVRKVMPSLSVPREHVFDIDLSGLREAESHFFRFSDSLTSGQGRAAPGSRRCSERR